MSRKLPVTQINETKALVIKLINQLEKEETDGYSWEFKDWIIKIRKNVIKPYLKIKEEQ